MPAFPELGFMEEDDRRGHANPALQLDLPLFLAQRARGIDQGYTTRGQQACDRRDGEEDQRHRHKRHAIARAGVEQQRRQQASQGQRADNSQNGPGGGKGEPLMQQHLYNRLP